MLAPNSPGLYTPQGIGAGNFIYSWAPGLWTGSRLAQSCRYSWKRGSGTLRAPPRQFPARPRMRFGLGYDR